MNLPDYLQFLDPVQDQLNKIYSIASLILTVLIGLWLFNFVAGLIQKTFSIGKAIGGVYRNYFHKYFRATILRLFSFTTYKRAVTSDSNID